ncbi:hypothetical protein [Candidatus Thiosymbion oneisti]|uniref:hypothetical protein n=1 Tax=Candidatus Thiosymbion oneisti TaxID=589554 RepID=UPI00159F0224|nr:hypothetical protein [Candidatus Thiosymbion oneisti]
MALFRVTAMPTDQASSQQLPLIGFLIDAVRGLPPSAVPHLPCCRYRQASLE